MQFSVIVPVYNIKDYLRECVDSILAQTNSNYELLLVDDGSTDGSEKICDYYANHYSEVNVIHRTNGGLSAARNSGIDVAQGNYLVFIDSDDYIADNSLEEISKSIGTENFDVIVTRLVQKYPNAEEIRNNSIMHLPQENSEEIVNWVFCRSANTWPAVQYIVSREFVKEKNLRFAEGYLHEDLAWTACLMASAEKVTVCSLPWYFHRMQREGSITATSKPKRVVDVISLALLTEEYLEHQDIEIQKKEKIRNRIFLSISSILSQYSIADDSGKKEIQRAVSENIRLFAKFSNRRGRAFNFSLHILGTHMTLELFSILQRAIHRVRLKNYE